MAEAMENTTPKMWPAGRPGYFMRMAREPDIEPLMKLLAAMAKENMPLPYDLDDIRVGVTSAISNGLSFVVVKGEDIVAGVALQMGSSWFNKKYEYLGDLYLYVHPKHRSYPIAAAMVENCKAAAKVVGVPLFLGIMSAKDPIRKLKFMERHMKPLGGYFISGV